MLLKLIVKDILDRQNESIDPATLPLMLADKTPVKEWPRITVAHDGDCCCKRFDRDLDMLLNSFGAE